MSLNIRFQSYKEKLIFENEVNFQLGAIRENIYAVHLETFIVSLQDWCCCHQSKYEWDQTWERWLLLSNFPWGRQRKDEVTDWRRTSLSSLIEATIKLVFIDILPILIFPYPFLLLIVVICVHWYSKTFQRDTFWSWIYRLEVSMECEWSLSHPSPIHFGFECMKQIMGIWCLNEQCWKGWSDISVVGRDYLLLYASISPCRHCLIGWLNK